MRSHMAHSRFNPSQINDLQVLFDKFLHKKQIE